MNTNCISFEKYIDKILTQFSENIDYAIRQFSSIFDFDLANFFKNLMNQEIEVEMPSVPQNPFKNFKGFANTIWDGISSIPDAISNVFTMFLNTVKKAPEYYLMYLATKIKKYINKRIEINAKIRGLLLAFHDYLDTDFINNPTFAIEPRINRILSYLKSARANVHSYKDLVYAIEGYKRAKYHLEEAQKFLITDYETTKNILKNLPEDIKNEIVFKAITISNNLVSLAALVPIPEYKLYSLFMNNGKDLMSNKLSLKSVLKQFTDEETLNSLNLKITRFLNVLKTYKEDISAINNNKNNSKLEKDYVNNDLDNLILDIESRNRPKNFAQYVLAAPTWWPRIESIKVSLLAMAPNPIPTSDLESGVIGNFENEMKGILSGPDPSVELYNSLVSIYKTLVIYVYSGAVLNLKNFKYRLIRLDNLISKAIAYDKKLIEIIDRVTSEYWAKNYIPGMTDFTTVFDNGIDELYRKGLLDENVANALKDGSFLKYLSMDAPIDDILNINFNIDACGQNDLIPQTLKDTLPISNSTKEGTLAQTLKDIQKTIDYYNQILDMVNNIKNNTNVA